MNKREKEIIRVQLSDEEKTLKYLKQVYQKASEDIRESIAYLDTRLDLGDPNISSIVYQKKYQEAILKQIETGLEDLNKNQYKTLQDFFEGSYVNGYVGSMYNLEGQGIPLTVPIDPKQVTKAVQIDSKLSKKYYQNREFPENINRLKLSIKAEVSRGIASGKTWSEVAYNIASGMNSPFDRALNDAMRIVRTEGHRINQQGFLDAGDEAKKHGADILKQWDSTLDSRTRPWHQEADGQIREWEEDFIVHGEKMKAPSVGGSASNVINCRCQLLQRARWMLDEDELKTLQERAEYFGLDKTKDFEEYREKFLKIPEKEEDSEERIKKIEQSISDDKKRVNEIDYEIRDTEQLISAGSRKGYSKYDQYSSKQELIDRRTKLFDEIDELSEQWDDWLSKNPRPSRSSFFPEDDDISDEMYEELSKMFKEARNKWKEERDKYEEFINNEIYKRRDEIFDLKDAITAWNDIEKYREALKIGVDKLRERKKALDEEQHNLLLGILKKEDEISKLKKMIEDNLKNSGVDVHFNECRKLFKNKNVDFVPVATHKTPISEEKIIKTLAGWDQTDGSCASVAFAYIGQKNGFDVRDFRGGSSMKTFRNWDNLLNFVQMDGLKILKGTGASTLTVGNRLVQQVQEGKEYYLCTGRHASIVRKKDGVLQYLELQADPDCPFGGWQNFSSKPRETLKDRFGCSTKSAWYAETHNFMIDLEESNFNKENLQTLLGYINTNEGEQKKGEGGWIR